MREILMEVIITLKLFFEVFKTKMRAYIIHKILSINLVKKIRII